MTQISDELDATLMLVRAADPLSRADAPPLDTEADLRVLLANLPPADPPRSQRVRRPLVLGAVGLAAAAATVAAINLAPSNQGASGSLGGGFVSQAQAAQIIAKVKRVLGHYPAGEIVVIRESQTTIRGTRTIASLTFAQWLSTSAPYRGRVAFTVAPGRGYEEGTTRQGLWQLYDPARNTIYQRTSNPGYTLTRGPRAGWWTVTLPKASVYTPDTTVPLRDRGNTTIVITDKTARALRSGVKEIAYTYSPSKSRAHEYWLAPKVQPGLGVTGGTQPAQPPADWVKNLTTRGTRVRLDGKGAIEISRGHNDTMWFSAKALTPIKEIVRYHGYTTTTRYREFTVLKGAAASTRLLSVRLAHPSAKLVIGVAPLYYAAKRLGI